MVPENHWNRLVRSSRIFCERRRNATTSHCDIGSCPTEGDPTSASSSQSKRKRTDERKNDKRMKKKKERSRGSGENKHTRKSMEDTQNIRKAMHLKTVPAVSWVVPNSAQEPPE